MPGGIYSFANIVFAGVAAVLTGPVGNVFPDPDGGEFPWLRTAPGYYFTVSDGSGRLIGDIRSPGPLPVDLADLPDSFINAVIAAEDARFLEHEGIDPVGLAAAAIDSLRGRLRGGSGITQQMVKNTVVGAERTFGRKLIEAVLASRLHHALGPREILRSYLESAWFGRGETGAVRASEVWFGKSWDQVSLAEAATLAGMLKGPALYDPYRHPDRTRLRRDAILGRMLELGWISAEAHAGAIAAPVVAIPPPRPVRSSAALRDLMSRDLARSGHPDGGEIILGQDPRWQSILETELGAALQDSFGPRDPDRVDAETLARIGAEGRLRRSDLLELPPGSPYRSGVLLGSGTSGWQIAGLEGLVTPERLDGPVGWTPAAGQRLALLDAGTGTFRVAPGSPVEAAVVILDPRTGQVLAISGAADEGLSAYNRAAALRQPGSAVKPFLYLAALTKGFGPQTGVEDVVRSYPTGNGQSWTPKNYDGSQAGLIPMHVALERSSNLASAWLAQTIGIEAMARMAEAAGAYGERQMNRHATSALGASETSLLDLTSGFGAILNGGVPREPRVIQAILGADGAVRDMRGIGPDYEVIAPSEAIDALVGMLRGVVTRGTASEALAGLPFPVVGKTGTTQDYRDAWFIGGTPHLAIGIWIGRDDNQPLPGKAAGGRTAAPVAGRILSKALEAGLLQPDGLRDPQSAPAITWPPVPHARDGGQAPVAQVPRVTAVPDGRRPHADAADPEAGPSAADMANDAFWGVREAQSGHLDIPDRNADLLQGSW